MSNYYGGIIIEELNDSDFVAGLNSPLKLEPRVVGRNHKQFLAAPELQTQSWGETSGCVSFSATHHVCAPGLNWMLQANILQSTYPAALKFLKDNGYIGPDGMVNLSERFTYAMSGTDPSRGNSGSKVCQTIRNFGIVPEAICPNIGPTNVQEYLTVSDQAKTLGLESKKYFNFAWQAIPTSMINDYLIQAPVMIFTGVCPGWGTENPVKTCQLPVQHATGQYAPVSATRPIIDTYQPFFKELAKDYPVPYAFQIIIYPIPQSVPLGVPEPVQYKFLQDMVYGERSQNVLHLQQRLSVPPTGIYDDATRVAVFSYQLNHLAVTFKETILNLIGRRVGPATRAVLNK